MINDVPVKVNGSRMPIQKFTMADDVPRLPSVKKKRVGISLFIQPRPPFAKSQNLRSIIEGLMNYSDGKKQRCKRALNIERLPLFTELNQFSPVMTRPH